jgi:hypothetical protein
MEEIEVVIESLLLDGFEPADGQRFSAAFQDEFARRLRETGLPSGWSTNVGLQMQISLPTLNVGVASDPQSMGMQVARALYEGIEP